MLAMNYRGLCGSASTINPSRRYCILRTPSSESRALVSAGPIYTCTTAPFRIPEWG
jgi:hypothetical protein